MEFQEDIFRNNNSIRCIICNGYLSIFPIWIYLNGTSSCGRCEKQDENAVRALAFENFLKYFYFPCNYKKNGCVEKFKSDNLQHHEKSCVFKPINCPILTNSCNWSGSTSNVYEHIQFDHEECTFPDRKDNTCQIKLNMNDQMESNYVKMSFNHSFLIQIKIENRILYFNTSVIGFYNLANLHRYNLSISAVGSINKTFLYKQNVTESTNKQIDISKAITLTTTDLGINADFIMEIEFTQFEENDKIEGRISTLEKEAFLQEIKCPTCLNYIIPPIYQCVNGHLTCAACKDVQKTCSVCRVSMNGKIRNLFAERIAETFLYPCQNEGCKETYRYYNKEKHDNVCKYNFYSCIFFNCDQHFSFDMLYNHFELKHSKQIFDLKKTTWNLLQDDKMEKFVAKHGNNIFVIEKGIKGSYFYIGIELYATSENKKEYFCSVIFGSNKRAAEKFEYKFKCRKFLAKRNKIKTFQIPLDLLITFEDRFCITYSINLIVNNL